MYFRRVINQVLICFLSPLIMIKKQLVLLEDCHEIEKSEKAFHCSNVDKLTKKYIFTNNLC